MLLGQAALATALFTDKRLQDVPDDATDNEKKVYDFIKKHVGIAKWLAVGILLVEVGSVMMACVLKASSNRSEDSEDEDEYDNRRPLLRRGEDNQDSRYRRQNSGRPSNNQMRYSAWRERMREKYGLDTTKFSYEPEEAPEAGPSTEVKEESSCVIA